MLPLAINEVGVRPHFRFHVAGTFLRMTSCAVGAGTAKRWRQNGQSSQIRSEVWSKLGRSTVTTRRNFVLSMGRSYILLI